MKDLFLSFNSVDRESVRDVRRLLEARGVSTFLDELHIRSGLPVIPQIEQALLECKAVAVFLGPAVGPWQQREIWVALGRQIEDSKTGKSFPVIPVLLPGGSAGRGFLSSNSWVDLRGGLESGALDALVRGVHGVETAFDLEALGDLCPFRGLEPFREEDSLFFFGRAAVVAKLVERVETRKLVAVVGSSGCGKSSLVLAGLLPALRMQRSPNTTWEAVSFSPGIAPFARLAIALVEWLEPDLGATKQVTEAEDLAGRLERGEVRLAAYLEKGLASWGAKRLLLVVDQFEELLTQTKTESRKPFVRTLLSALDEAPVVLVPTLRGDFYGAACDLDADFSKLVEHGVLNLGRPSRDELCETITGPARLVGLRYEPELLVDKLLDDVGDEPGKLPLLEYALLELWRRRDGRKLLASAYQAVGGVVGAVAASAERVFERLNETQQLQARRLFVRLVRTSATTGGLENTRRRAYLSDHQNAHALVQDYAKPEVRLLVTARDETGRETVEIAHERLITAWQRLQDWLAQDTEFRLWRQRLEPSLGYFKKDATSLLTGEALEEARRWLDQPGAELEPDERALVEASLSKSRRLARWRKVAGVAFLLATLGLAMLAAGFYQSARKARREEARAQREEARAQRESARTSYTAALAEIDAERLDRALPHLAKAIRLDRVWSVPRDLALSLLQSVPVPRPGRRRYPNDGNILLDESNLLELKWDKSARLLDPKTGSERCSLLSLALPAQWSTATAVAGQLLTGTRTGEVQLWNLATCEPLGVRVSLGTGLRSSKLSPDGRFLILRTTTDVRILDAHTGAVVGDVYPSEGFDVDASLAPDVGRLLSAPSDQTLQAWDVASGRKSGPTLTTTEGFSSAALSPDGSRVASVASGRQTELLEIWDVKTGRRLAQQQGEPFDLRLGDFSPDGRRLAVFSRTGTARIWDARTASPLGVEIRHEQDVQAARFSVDGRRLLTSSLDGTVRLWDGFTGMPLGPSLGHSPGNLRGRFSDDGKRVFSTPENWETVFWHAPGGSPLALPLRRLAGLFAISPDGERLVVAGRDPVVSIQNLRTLKDLPLKVGARATIVEFNPNGRSILILLGDSSAQIWHPDSGKLVKVPGQPIDIPRRSSFSPDGRLLMVQVQDEVLILDASTATVRSRVQANRFEVRHAAFSPDLKWFATLTRGPLKLWNLSDSKPAPLEIPTAAFTSHFSFSPAGNRLATATFGGQVQVWDTSTRLPIGRSFGHSESIRDLKFSRYGGVIATASADGTARLWSADIQDPLTAPLRHRGTVYSVSFSNDGQRLLTTSEDGTARLWDVPDGLPTIVPLEAGGKNPGASFALGGQVVVTWSDERGVLLWPVFTSRPEEAELIADLAEAVAGQVSGPTGLQPIDNWRERQDEVIARVAEAPLGEMSAASLGRWLFMDPWERPVSPLFPQSVEQFICDALRHGAWDEAYRYYAGHPLLGKGPEDPLPAACSTNAVNSKP